MAEDYLNRMVAAELMSSAYCNMKCKYCYIPKVQEMKELHQDIVSDLQTDRPLETLKKTYGDRLECLSLWGTEPTLVLPYFTPNVHKYIEAFPKLTKFSFSTNLLTHYETIQEFMVRLNEIGKEKDKMLEFDLQVSLDGPDFITDTNRQEGATKKIVENYDSITTFTADAAFTHLKVHIGFKPTLTLEQIRLFNDDLDTFDKYFKFFDDLIDLGVNKSAQDKMLSIGTPGSGTIMVPGKYSSSDGKEFGLYMRNLSEYDFYVIEQQPYKYLSGNISEYVRRLQRVIKYSSEAVTSPNMFTCSGGDSNFALDRKDNLHICHRSFYLNEPKYAEAVAKTDIENWDVSVFLKERNQALQRTYIVNVDDKEAMARFQYSMRGFHDFTRFKENATMAMLLELIDCGQASEVYLDPDMAKMLAKFITSGFACSIESAINTGSIHLTPLSIIRMLANGAFEEMVKHYIELEVIRRR